MGGPVASRNLIDRDPPLTIWSKAKSTRKKYESIYVWRQDLRPLRELANAWGVSRVRAIHEMIAMIPTHPSMRPIAASPAALDRIFDLARALDMDRDDLLSKIVEVVSHCSVEEIGRIVSPDQQPPP